MLSIFKKRKFSIKPICILFFLMLHVAYCYGQDSLASKKIGISISETSLKVNNKDLKDITVHVKNSDTQPFKGYLYLHSAKGAKVATKDSVAVNLEAGKEIFVPTKIYVNQGTQEGSIYVGFALRTSDKTTIDTATLKLILTPSRLLTAYIDAEDMVLPKPGAYLSIPIRITNRGNVKESGVLVIAFPYALKDKSNFSIPFNLDPFKDTVVTFQRKVTRNMTKLGSMNVTINGIYDDGNIFATNLVTFQDLSSKRSFDEGSNTINQSNFISFGVQNAFDAGETYNLRSRGLYDIKDGMVGYNFNMIKWKEGSKELSINGSNLDLSYKRVGLRLGNISQGGELSFTGRGAEAIVYIDSAHRNKLFGGYMDKAINLYTTENQTSYGNSAWAGYKYEKQTLSSLTIFTHDVDNVSNINNDLLISNLTWKSSEHFSADLKAGVANSASTESDHESHTSMTVAFNYYAYFFKKLNITGTNSYATAYYPGIRRGTLYLNEAASYHINKSTISSTIMYSNAAPKYFHQAGQQINNENTNTTFNATYSITSGSLGLSFSPELYMENGSGLYNNTIEEGSMKAGRLSALVNISPVKIPQTFYFKTDVGLYKTDFDTSNKLQIRSMLSYAYRNFRLTGTLQQGNFYLGEAFQEHFANYNSFRLNIAPSITTFFFNNALKVDAGVAYNKDYYSKSYLMNCNMLLNLGKVAFYSNLQYNIYGNARRYKNIQFGVNYYLPATHPGKDAINKGKIELFLFYDLNMNGNYDKGDSLASGITIHVGKTIMMSGGDGKVTYNKLPPGNYSVFMPTQNGWYGHDLFINLKEKETKSFYIALSQTGTVHGNISYQFDTTYSVSITKDKAWQTIVATNKDGQRFETKTDENGDYNLYLPVGTYTINVDNLPNQIELLLKNNNVQPLQVESGKIINGVDFILKVKQRKVEIKKFGKQK